MWKRVVRFFAAMLTVCMIMDCMPVTLMRALAEEVIQSQNTESAVVEQVASELTQAPVQAETPTAAPTAAPTAVPTAAATQTEAPTAAPTTAAVSEAAADPTTAAQPETTPSENSGVSDAVPENTQAPTVAPSEEDVSNEPTAAPEATVENMQPETTPAATSTEEEEVAETVVEEAEEEQAEEEEEGFKPYYVTVSKNTKVYASASLSGDYKVLERTALCVIEPQSGAALRVRYAVKTENGMSVRTGYIHAGSWTVSKECPGAAMEYHGVMIPVVTYIVEETAAEDQDAEEEASEEVTEEATEEAEEEVAEEEVAEEESAEETVEEVTEEVAEETEDEESEDLAEEEVVEEVAEEVVEEEATVFMTTMLAEDPEENPEEEQEPVDYLVISDDVNINWDAVGAVMTYMNADVAVPVEVTRNITEDGMILIGMVPVSKKDTCSIQITVPAGYVLNTAAAANHTYAIEKLMEEPLVYEIINWPGDAVRDDELTKTWHVVCDTLESEVLEGITTATDGNKTTITVEGLKESYKYSLNVPNYKDYTHAAEGNTTTYTKNVAPDKTVTIHWNANNIPAQSDWLGVLCCGENETVDFENGFFARFGAERVVSELANNTQTVTFAGLPASADFSYSYVSNQITGYRLNKTGDDEYTYTELVEKIVEITWQGGKPAEGVTSQLYYNDGEGAQPVDAAFIERYHVVVRDDSTADKTVTRYGDLPEAGFTYTVVNTVPENYALVSTSEEGFKQTYVKLTDVTYTLTASDDAKDYLTEAMIAWTVSASNGAETEQVCDTNGISDEMAEAFGSTMTKEYANDVMSVSVTNVPVCDSEGNALTYTMQPAGVAGGHWEQNGNAFTFVKDTTYQTVKAELWDGYDASRPQTLDYALYVTIPGESEPVLLQDSASGYVNEEFLPGYGWGTTNQQRTTNGIEIACVDLPMKDADGQPYVYSIVPVKPEGYSDADVERAVDEDSDYLWIKTKTISITKEWRDASVTDETRPSMGDWVGASGYGLDGTYHENGTTTYPLHANSEMTNAGDYTISQNGRDWNMEITVYAYSSPNTITRPYVVENPRAEMSQDTELGLYETKQNNPEYEDENTAGRLYDGAFSESTIVDNRGIVLTKVWLDEDPTKRPTMRFRLFRYSESSGETGSAVFAHMSPVEGFDGQTYGPTSEADEQTILYAAEDALPVYDTNGYRYNYILREDLSGTNSGSYSLVNGPSKNAARVTYIDADGKLYNDDGVQVDCDGNIYNVRTGVVGVPFTKVWEAKAVQSMDAHVKFGVRRRLKNDATSQWELLADVEQKDLSFTAEYPMKSDAFGNLPQYDEEGREYVYEVVETQIRSNDSVIDPPEGLDYIPDGSYTTSDGNFTVITSHRDDGTIVNRLQLNMILEVDKRWEPALPADGSITVTVRRDGNPVTYQELAEKIQEWPDGATLNADGTITMNMVAGTSAKTFQFKGLPQFDEVGREFTYDVVEDQDNIVPSGYHLSLTEFSNSRNEESRQLTVHEILHNVYGDDGDGITFIVKKVWQDDSDSGSRLPVDFKLYYTGNGSEVEVASERTNVTEIDQWRVEFSYSLAGIPEGDPRRNPSNYVIHEIGLDFNGTKYPVQTITIGEETLTTYTRGIAADRTPLSDKGQKYTVSESREDNTFTFTNTRVGTVSINIVKNWNTGDITEFNGKDGLRATFQLKRDGDVYATEGHPDGLWVTEPYYYVEGSYGPGTVQLDIKDLPKYDETGVLYTYTLEEVSLNDKPFVNHALNGEGGNYRIISSKSEGAYEVHKYRSEDLMHFTFSNTRTASDTLSIRKLWRDDGKGTRPDIVLELYRRGANAKDRLDFIKTDNLWNTGDNHWLWECVFKGTFDLYDKYGFPYEYFVREKLSGTTNYKGYYYNGVPSGLNEGGANTIAVFAETGNLIPIGGNYAQIIILDENGNAKKQDQLVVNRIENTINFNGRKAWEVPSWYLREEYPTVKLNIEKTYGEPRSEKTEMALKQPYEMGPKSNYTFSAVLDEYDEYGIPFAHFRVVEVESNGEQIEIYRLPGYDPTSSEDGFTLVNTYTGDNKVKFRVEKTWDLSDLTPDVAEDMKAKTYPDVTFKLYRTYKNDFLHSTVGPEQVGQVTIKGSEIAAGTTEIVSADIMLFKNGKETTEVGWYETIIPAGIDADDYYYTYTLKEFIGGREMTEGQSYLGYTLLAGSTNTFGSAAVRALSKSADKTGVYAFSNKYDAGSKTTVTAKKTWSGDAAFKSMTRPADEDWEAVKLTLYRSQKVNGTTVEEEVPHVTAAWSDNGDNTWTCTFTGADGEKFPKYGPNNLEYTYYVKETMSSALQKLYSSSVSGMTAKNTLKTVSVLVKKNWVLNDGNTSSSAWNAQTQQYLAEIFRLMGLTADQTLSFTVSDNLGVMDMLSTQDAYKNKITQTFAYTKSELYSQNGLTLLDKLPAYIYNRDTHDALQITYTVTEASALGHQVIDSFVDGTNKVISVANNMTVSGSKFTGNTTNTIAVLTLNVKKLWDDAYNQDGLRPHSLTITLKEKVSGETLTRTLNWTNGTESPVVVFKVPIDKTYTVEEVTIDGYTAKYKLDSSEFTAGSSAEIGVTEIGKRELTFENDYVPQLVDLSVEKQWTDFDDYFALRPEYVTVQLQRKTEKGNTWEDVGEPVVLNDNNEWKHTWEDQEAYRVKTATEPIYEYDKYIYRVTETAVGGYKSNSPQQYTIIRDTETAKVTIENTLIVTGEITVKKIWQDNNDRFSTRPASITLTLQHSDDNGQTWADVVIGGAVVEKELTTDNWSWTINSLPQQAPNGTTYKYRVVENKNNKGEEVVPFGYIVTHQNLTAEDGRSGTVSATNTLDTRDIPVQKEYIDDNDAYGLRVEVTVGLYAKTAKTDWQPVTLSDAQGQAYQLKLNKDNRWEASFVSLPKVNANGETISYQIREMNTGDIIGYTYGGDQEATSDAKVIVTNELDLGNVSISKSVVGDQVSANGDVFTFTVQMTAPANVKESAVVDRTYALTWEGGDGTEPATLTVDADGKATITLKDQQKVTINAIVAGTTVTVTENDYKAQGYITTVNGTADANVGNSADMTVVNKETAAAAFTNERHTGTYTLSKELAGSGVAEYADTQFHFTLNLVPAADHSTYTDRLINAGYFTTAHTYATEQSSITEVAFNANGIAEIALKGGEQIKIVGLPCGVSITAKEHDANADASVITRLLADGFIIEAAANGADLTAYNPATGVFVVINETTTAATAAFKNTRNIGSLTVEKQLAGNAAEIDKIFSMTVTLTYPDNVTVPDVVKSTMGDLTATPVAGQDNTVAINIGLTGLDNAKSVTLNEIATGTAYKVEEVVYTEYGFVTTYDAAAEGEITDGNVKTVVTNERNTANISVDKTVIGVNNVGQFAFTMVLTYEDEIDLTKEDNLPEVVAGEALTSVISGQTITYTTKLGNGEKFELGNVLLGTDYTITEANYIAEGFDTPTVTKPDGMATDAYTVSAVDLAADSAWNYTNTRETGSLSITKTLAGNAPIDGMEFTFLVTLNATESGKKPQTSYPATLNGAAADPVAFTMNDAGTAATATVMLHGGDTLQINNITQGITYTVEESSYVGYGYITTYTGESGMIANTVAAAVFTNKRDTASISVTKQVSGSGSDRVGKFAFTMVLTYENDIDLTKTENLPIVVTGEALTTPVISDKTITYTTKLGHGEEFKLGNVLLGTDYTINEADYSAEGFTVTKVKAAGAEGDEEMTRTVTAADLAADCGWIFTNIREAGSLIVEKKLDGNAPIAGKTFAFQVKLEAVNGVLVHATYPVVRNEGKPNATTGELHLNLNDARTEGTATIYLQGGETLRVNDISDGLKYTVTETDYKAEGYTTTPANNEGNVSATAPETALFTNERSTAGISVTKQVTGSGSDRVGDFAFTMVLTFENFIDLTVADNLPVIASEDGQTTVKVDNTKKTITYQTTISDGKKFELSNVLLRTKYNITEANYTADGFDTPIVTKPDGTEVTAYTVSEEEGLAANSAWIFTNNREAGSLLIKKTLDGNAPIDGKVFTFHVTLTASEDGMQPHTTYPIQKNGEDAGSISFTLNEDGTAISEPIELLGGETLQINDITAGITYAVAEEYYDDYGYHTISTGETGEIEKETVAEAEFTNERSTGSISIQKVLAGSGEDRVGEYEFTLVLGFAEEIDLSIPENLPVISAEVTETEIDVQEHTITYTTAIDNGGIFKLDNILLGTGYSIAEADYTDEGYKVTVITSSEGAEIEGREVVDEALTEDIDWTFTNTREAGSLLIKKTVAGNAPIAGKTFTFHVTLKAANDVLVHETYPTLKNGKQAGTITFTVNEDRTEGKATIELKGGETLRIDDITQGIEYVVTEDDYQKDGYLTTATGTTGSITATVATAAFTNTRDQDSLTIRKLLEGNAADYVKSFNMTVTLSREDDVPVAGTYKTAAGAEVIFTATGERTAVAKVAVRGNGSVKILGIPRGTSYTVAEADYSGMDYTTVYHGRTGKIVENGSTATVINTRNAGTLSISKTVISLDNLPGDLERVFAFNVNITKEDGTPLNRTMDVLYNDGTLTTVTFSEGAAQIGLRHGETATILDIPEYATYSVTEHNYPGVTTTSSGAAGVITIDGASASFINTIEQSTVDLTVRKVWNDLNNKDKFRPISITVTVTGGSYNETFELSEENQWQIVLTELPKYDENGQMIHYAVEEKVPDKYKVTYSVVGQVIIITNTHKPVPFIVITDDDTPIGAGINLNEGYCFD